MSTTLKVSATQAAATTVNAIPTGDVFLWNNFDGIMFQLDVTAASTLITDTLNVYIQHSIDGINWDDAVSFTQVLGNGGAKRFVAAWNRIAVPGTAVRALADGTLAAGTVNQGPVSDGQCRVKAVTVGTGSFTFAVAAAATRRVGT